MTGKSWTLTELVSAGESCSCIKTLERSGLSLAVYGGSVIVDKAKVWWSGVRERVMDSFIRFLRCCSLFCRILIPMRQ